MTLRQKQSVFCLLSTELIRKAFSLGFELTYGYTYRSPEESARLAKLGLGIKDSLHGLKLAIDLNLFSPEGKYLTSTESHRPLGEWWESQSTSDYTCCWGGRWGDGNHYSIAHAGRK